MSQATRWSTQFKIPDETLSGYSREAQAAGTDLLQWCLMNGKIPQDEYLAWATKTYELPIVKSEFFTSPPDLELWKNTKELGPWSPTLVPLTEWEGCLFVGCLEPPTNFSIEKRCQFVLASARNLFMLWDQLNPTQVAEKAPAAPQSNPAPETTGVITLGPPPDPTPDIADSASQEEELTTPDFSRQMPGENELQASSMQETEPAENDAEVISFNEPESPPPAAEPAVTAKAEATDAAEEPAQTPVTAAAAPEPKPEAEPQVQQAPSETPAAAEKPLSEEATIVGEATVKMSPSEEVTAVSADVAAAPPVAVREPRPLEACTSKEDLGAIVNSHILKTFDGAMILTYDQKSLTPWLYSDLFRSEKNKELPTVEVETPSIFRIVIRTRLPYHGYVTPSPTNNAFFGAYLGGKIPKHATLVPVLVEEEIFGVLMGVSEHEIDYRSSLVQMEKLADEMAQHLARLKQSAAA